MRVSFSFHRAGWMLNRTPIISARPPRLKVFPEGGGFFLASLQAQGIHFRLFGQRDKPQATPSPGVSDGWNEKQNDLRGDNDIRKKQAQERPGRLVGLRIDEIGHHRKGINETAQGDQQRDNAEKSCQSCCFQRGTARATPALAERVVVQELDKPQRLLLTCRKPPKARRACCLPQKVMPSWMI